VTVHFLSQNETQCRRQGSGREERGKVARGAISKLASAHTFPRFAAGQVGGMGGYRGVYRCGASRHMGVGHARTLAISPRCRLTLAGAPCFCARNLSSEDPWGWRGLASGWAGALGQADPAFRSTGAAAALAGRMPASWRGACRTGHQDVRPDGCEVRVSTRRDREAATRQTTQHCATLYSVVKGTAQREASPRSE